MKFRKKPIVVEAYQLTEEKEIHTREGTVKGYPGDWIITGIQGEIYPCGKEIFEQTYEPADTRTSSPAPSRNILDTDLCVCSLTEQQCRDKTNKSAAQAREKVLDELQNWLTGERSVPELDGCYICIYGSVDPDEGECSLWDKIEFLRGHHAVVAIVPAPDLHSVIMKTESEIAADKLNEAAYTRGKIDGAKAERERAERILKETLRTSNRYPYQTPSGLTGATQTYPQSLHFHRCILPPVLFCI